MTAGETAFVPHNDQDNPPAELEKNMNEAKDVKPPRDAGRVDPLVGRSELWGHFAAPSDLDLLVDEFCDRSETLDYWSERMMFNEFVTNIGRDGDPLFRSDFRRKICAERSRRRLR